MKSSRSLATAWALIWILIPAPEATASEAMRIVTYPIGLVAGELEVKVDLGPLERPADLYLDGRRACSLTPMETACTVDLGPDPHVHLLELVRADGERVERWVNRPGQEAELGLAIARSSTAPEGGKRSTAPEGGKRSTAPEGGKWSTRCQARLSWAHPLRQNPLELALTLDGEALQLDARARSAAFGCSPADGARLLVASGVFPDGRRVEAVAMIGGFGDQADVALAAVPLVADSGAACGPDSGGTWPASAERLEPGGYEVVFVLDPEAAYRPLTTHRNLTTSRALVTKAKSKLQDAERMWFVLPNRDLFRVNGFAKSPPNWLGWLFTVGRTEIEGKPRIADAVAASGLVAAAGPRRRVVVLILGNKVSERDGSLFTPRQAREYLAEVGVPLVVLRHGKRRDDGWPAGLYALGQDGVAQNLDAIEEILDRQCLAWFPGELDAGRLADLPEGVRLAGRDGDAPASPESVWARAEVEPAEPPAVAGVVAERLDVTAVTVLLSATGEDGAPVADLAAGDLEASEDGTPVTVLGLAALNVAAPAPEPAEQTASVAPPERPAAKDLPVAIYVDRSLGGGSDLRLALRAVAGEAARLTALGPVELVEADRSQVRTLIGPTRDPAALVESLDQLGRRGGAIHAVERIRRRFLESIRQTPTRAAKQGPAGQVVSFTARASASEEDVILSRALDRLRYWALRESGHRAGLLLVVGAGFDEDPSSFYQGFVDKLEFHNSTEIRAQLLGLRQSTKVGDLGRELAGTGWRLLPVAGQTTATSTATADSRTDKFFTFMSAGSEAVRADHPDWLMLDPIGSQRHLAAASGGDAVVGDAGLRAALDQASGWYLLSYQVARPPDGATHELAIRPLRAGIEVTSNQLVTAATSEGQAAARALRLLGGSTDHGELSLDLRIGTAAEASRESWLSAEIEAMLGFGELAAVIHHQGGPKLLRVSIATATGDAEPTVEHRDQRLTGKPGGWIYTFPFEWPAEGGRLAVTVEELASGLWGGAVVELGGER